VLVLPSDGGETWGLVVNEAMACGLPAIVSDAVGCAPDLVEDGKTGFTFPLGDCSALAERLASMAKLKQAGHDFSPVLAQKMRDYSLDAVVEGTLRALDAVGRASPCARNPSLLRLDAPRPSDGRGIKAEGKGEGGED
jgi:glycosyltransferase involved in cell wall biosynthesis